MAPDLVQFPNPNVEFIIGPQLRMGSARNPCPYFDQIQLNKGVMHGNNFPKVPPMNLTGVVIVETGLMKVRGVGTRFLSEVDPSGPAPFFNGRFNIREAGGAYQYVQVRSVESDNELTLTEPYRFGTQGNVKAGTFYTQVGAGHNGDIYSNANYYDLVACLYALAYRTGDPEHLALARKTADSWFIASVKTPSGFSPRSASLTGLMLRALDGRPEMWDWIVPYARTMFDPWLKRFATQVPPITYFHNGIRDSSYMMLFAVQIAKCLPDSYPNAAAIKAEFMADAETAALDYYVRLQKPDGSFRWDDDYYQIVVDGIPVIPHLRNIMQPFMVGLLLHALIDVSRATANPQTRQTINASVLKAVDHLYTGGPWMSHNAGIPGSSLRWRGWDYFYHGGTLAEPEKYARGSYFGVNATSPYDLENVRQSTSTILHALGFAFAETGDQKYAQWGDDLYDSVFGFSEDGVGNYVAGFDSKGYNQNFRDGGRYLAWRYQNAAPITSPYLLNAPAVAAPGDNISVSWDAPAGHSANDWIGLYKEGDIPSAFVSWQYTGAAANGSVSFALPTEVGKYEFRIYLNDRSKFEVSKKIEVTRTTPPPVIDPPPPITDEYKIETFKPGTEKGRSQLYQRMRPLGYGAWEELTGNNIKFRRFSSGFDLNLTDIVTKPFSPATEKARTALYQASFNEGVSPWEELTGNKIKFRRFLKSGNA